MTAITDFIKVFENNRDHYLSIESYVENVCKEHLRKSKIEFLWQSRVKAVDSLAKKLNGRRDTYQNEADNVADIKDLVGARILLVRSGDASLVEQVISEKFAIRNEAQHPKSGAVSERVRFRGYDAHHYYVTLPGEQHKYPIIIEIQVTSVIMWTWATLNHDIEYKVLKGDQPKSAHSALEALLGLANVTAVVTGLVEDLLCSDQSPLRQQDNLSSDVATGIRDFLFENRDQLYSKPNPPDLPGSSSRLVGDKDLERTSFLKWISPIDFDADQHAISAQRWPGTGNWLYEDLLFQQWYSSPSSRVLWCKGIPGSGKSVLSSGVIDGIRNSNAREKGFGVAFVYFRYFSADVQKPENILAALVKELCRTMEQVPERLLDSFRFHSKNDTRPNFQACIEQFDTAVKNFNGVFIVMDALDECESEVRRLILELIWDATRKFPCIKFFVTSRPENDIREYFEELRVPTVEVDAQKDIELYLRSRIDQLTEPLGSSGKPRTQRLRIQSTATKDEVFQALVNRADGLFLWAKLQLDNLCLQRNEKDIKTELYSLPRGLHATYSRMLDQIEKQPEALRLVGMKCLMWVLNARRSLSLAELRDAVAVDEGLTKYVDLAENIKKYTFEDLIDSCRNLLVPERLYPHNSLSGRETVRPLHYTFQKFFDQRHMSSLDRQEYPLRDSILNKNVLAKLCLIYLELFCVNSISIRDDDKPTLINSHPFIWYCSSYFDDHFINSPMMTPDLLDRARSLLSMSDRALAMLLQLRQQEVDDFDEFYRAVNAKTVIILTRLYEVPQLLSYTEWSNSRVHSHALHYACSKGHYAGVKRLLAIKHDPNIENVSRRTASRKTPLDIVAESYDSRARSNIRLPIARLLLKHGAKSNKENRAVWSVINKSVFMGDKELVKLLLEFNVDINGEDSSHPSALETAFEEGYSEIAKLLLQRGALPSIEALVEAAENEDEELVNLMLDQGLDVNAINHQDRNYFYAASMQGPKRMKPRYHRRWEGSLGRSWGFEDGNVRCPGSALLKAARCGYVNAVETLLKRGAHIQGSGLDDTPILAAAAAMGLRELVELLLAGGADPDRQDPNGGTPLLRAIGLRSHPLNLQLVELLLQAGANVNGRENTNSEILSASPLQVAILIGSAQIVKILIQRNADVTASEWVEFEYQFHHSFDIDINRRYAKRTALQVACVESRHLCGRWDARLEIVRELLRAGADINATGEYGITALQLACTYGGDGNEAIQIIELLLRSGADVNANGLNISNDSAMIFENSYGYFALDRVLPEVTWFYFSKPLLGIPPVHRASFRGQAEILAMLLAAGADVHVQSHLGTPIEAAYTGYYHRSENARAWVKVIEMLRKEGAPEPRHNYHIGVLCNGPLCNEEEGSSFWDLKYAGRSKWISGDRYKCINCKIYNLCTGCKDRYDRNIRSQGMYHPICTLTTHRIKLTENTHRIILKENTHRMIKLTVREDIVDQ